MPLQNNHILYLNLLAGRKRLSETPRRRIQKFCAGKKQLQTKKQAQRIENRQRNQVR